MQIPWEIKLREDLVNKGLLRSKRLDNLVIYTYTAKANGENWWEKYPILLESRGHIFDIDTGECIAYPLPKFFNMNEKSQTQEGVLPWQDGYKIYEKFDGWLGTLYRHNGQFKIATRGSFDSPGAVWATGFLQSNYDLSGLPEDITLVFEIISPITKIVVNYDRETLVLTAAFNRHSRRETDHQILGKQFNFPTALDLSRILSLNQMFDDLEEVSGKEKEGYVIRFMNGLRVKIKAKDYLKRANLLKKLTPLGVWRSMQNGMASKEMEAMFQDDHLKEFVVIARNLEKQYRTVSGQIGTDYHSVLDGTDWSHPSRKDFAESVQKTPTKHKKIMFAIHDGNKKAINRYIMEQIRPANNLMEKSGEQ
jgi:RNA ligase